MYANCLTADTELNACFDTLTFRTDAWQTQDRFATMPVLAVIPAYQPPSEEELHTSFEQAISDRLLVVNKQLSLKSGPLAHTERLELNTEPLSQHRHHSSITNVAPATEPLQQRSGKLLPELLGNVWQRSIIFASLTLMLMLLGFDLMGLLVLHMR